MTCYTDKGSTQITIYSLILVTPAWSFAFRNWVDLLNGTSRLSVAEKKDKMASGGMVLIKYLLFFFNFIFWVSIIRVSWRNPLYQPSWKWRCTFLDLPCMAHKFSLWSWFHVLRDYCGKHVCVCTSLTNFPFSMVFLAMFSCKLCGMFCYQRMTKFYLEPILQSNKHRLRTLNIISTFWSSYFFVY